jgi:hypothetical protein
MHVLDFSIVFQVVSEEWLAGQGFSRSRSSQENCISATSFVIHRLCSSQYPIVPITSTDHAQHVKRFISDPLIHMSMLSLVRETMAASSRRKTHEHMPLQRPMNRGKTGGKVVGIRMMLRMSCTVAISISYDDERLRKSCKPRRRKPGHKELQQAHPYCRTPCL